MEKGENPAEAPKTVDAPPANPPTPAGDPPKAAKTVAEGKTEAEIAAEQRAEAAERRAKTAETIAAEWQDKATQLERVQKDTRRQDAKPKKKESIRFTLLHPREED